MDIERARKTVSDNARYGYTGFPHAGVINALCIVVNHLDKNANPSRLTAADEGNSTQEDVLQ